MLVLCLQEFHLGFVQLLGVHGICKLMLQVWREKEAALRSVCVLSAIEEVATSCKEAVSVRHFTHDLTFLLRWHLVDGHVLDDIHLSDAVTLRKHVHAKHLLESISFFFREEAASMLDQAWLLEH